MESTNVCIQFYFTTECGRIFQWASPNLDSLIRDIHERGMKAKEIRTLEEQEALERSMEMASVWMKGMKESA